MEEQLTVATFNTWAGSLTGLDLNPVGYIKTLARDHHVVGLQEVHQTNDGLCPKERYVHARDPGSRVGPIDTQLYNHLFEALTDTHEVFYTSHFREGLHDCEIADKRIQYGNMLLVRRDCRIVGHHADYIWGSGELNSENRKTLAGRPGSRAAQCITIKRGRKYVTIMNIHGLWTKRGKIDIPARVVQSENIIRLIEHHHARLSLTVRPLVLVMGDLNYTSVMDTLHDLVASPQLFPDGGVNLNTQFGVIDTRTIWYKKPGREADFMLTGGILAESCLHLTVDYNAPSDHACLTATFDLWSTT